MSGLTPLIPDRTCGACHACCTVFDIDDAPVHKSAGVICPNYNGHVCAKYADRPQTCRSFHCLWRYETMLDENWRPDLSGVVLTTEPATTGAASGQAVSLLVFGDHNVIFEDGFAIYVATNIDRGHEALLKISRGIGRLVPEAQLSVFVGEAVAAGSLARVKMGIREAYRAVMTIPIADIPADLRPS